MTSKTKFETIVVEGEIAFPKILQPDNGGDAGVPSYNLLLATTPELLATLKSNGLSDRTRTDRTIPGSDKTYVKLSRPVVSATTGKTLSPPHVFMMDGTEIQGAIGNGTTARIELVKLGTGKKSTLRLNAVGIINHVVYERPEGEEADFTELARKRMGGAATTTKTPRDTGFI